jgi:hypothetical protein
MPLPEVLPNLLQGGGHLVVGELEDPSDQVSNASLSFGREIVNRKETLGNDPPGVRCESYRQAGYRDGGHQ